MADDKRPAEICRVHQFSPSPRHRLRQQYTHIDALAFTGEPKAQRAVSGVQVNEPPLGIRRGSQMIGK